MWGASHLPNRLQGRHHTKRTSCGRGLQGFVVPIKRDPEPKCVACNAHLRGVENITQVTSFRSWLTCASRLMVWSWTAKQQTSEHRGVAWVMQEIWVCPRNIPLRRREMFYTKHFSLWWEIQWAELYKVALNSKCKWEVEVGTDTSQQQCRNEWCRILPGGNSGQKPCQIWNKDNALCILPSTRAGPQAVSLLWRAQFPTEVQWYLLKSHSIFSAAELKSSV